MIRSPVLLSLMVLHVATLSTASAVLQRSDHYDYPTGVSQPSLGPGDDLASWLFTFPPAQLYPVYTFFQDIGLNDGVAALAVVFVVAAVAFSVTSAADFMIVLLGSLTERRSLSGPSSLTPEAIQSAVELIERAAALWE